MEFWTKFKQLQISKVCCEYLFSSYISSFFKGNSNQRLATVRAGNVIGGGDYSEDRLIPDIYASAIKTKKIILRNPQSVRPWQHVLEPLSGYISLSIALSQNKKLNGEAFNFGPPSYQNHTVKELVDEIITHWKGAEWLNKSKENNTPKEAGLLKLNCDKALHSFGWKATLNFKEKAKWTGEWYKTFYEDGPEAASLKTQNQIKDYMEIATKRNTFKLY